MCTVTATEFRQNFGKYNALAQKEMVVVTSRGKPIYTLVPQRMKDLHTLRALKGIIPKDATFGTDPNERD